MRCGRGSFQETDLTLRPFTQHIFISDHSAMNAGRQPSSASEASLQSSPPNSNVVLVVGHIMLHLCGLIFTVTPLRA